MESILLKIKLTTITEKNQIKIKCQEERCDANSEPSLLAEVMDVAREDD